MLSICSKQRAVNMLQAWRNAFLVRLPLIVAASFCTALPVDADAMGVTPVTVVLAPSGSRASSQIVVSNADNRNLPVELNISKLTLLPSGAVQRTPDSEDFVVLPTQSIVAPNSEQVFRIQYVGNPDLLESQAFEVSVDQVPVDLGKESGGATVQIVYSITAIVVVGSSSGEANISVQKAELVPDKARILHATAYFHNDGARHAFLDEGRMIISASDSAGKIVWEKTLNSEEIRQQIGIGYLPPHFTRPVELPFEFPSQADTVKIFYKQKSVKSK